MVRLHPYHCGRILARSPVLAPLGQIACRHHERTDGTGYPAGIRGSELNTTACLLAVADVFYALGEPRPHRPAVNRTEAARVLYGLPLDPDAKLETALRHMPSEAGPTSSGSPRRPATPPRSGSRPGACPAAAAGLTRPVLSWSVTLR